MSSKVPDNIENAPTEIKGQFPGLWWNSDRYENRDERVNEIKNKTESADVFAIVDSDADGRACEIIIREKFDNPIVVSAGDDEYGISIRKATEILSNSDSSLPVIMADLSPNDAFSSYLASIANIESTVEIYDHHDWNWSSKTSIKNVADKVIINEEKCAAQVLQENIYPEADEQLIELLEVTADHDLWRKEDERSQHLSTLSFALSRDEYIEYAREYGANMVRESDKLREIYEESEEKSEKMKKIAVEKAETYHINGYEVAITYLLCHQSRVGDELVENGADLAVILQPTTGFSFRSTEEFGRCSEIARGLNGGGHKAAAGGGFYDMFEFDSDCVSADEIYIPEIDGSEKPDVEDISKMEYLWRKDGEPAKKAMLEYLELAL